jgi:nicotinamidase-related amidase
LADATLLVLDLQRLFVDPASPAYLRTWASAAPGCAALIAAFRAAGRPVIFTRHTNPEPDDAGVIAHFGGRPLRPDDPLAALHPDWLPRPGEPLLDKARYSPWWRTELASLVPPASVLVVAGVTTHRCVLSAAVEAASRDRLPVVAADACATHGAVLQLAALRCVAHGYGHVASCQELIDAL